MECPKCWKANVLVDLQRFPNEHLLDLDEKFCPRCEAIFKLRGMELLEVNE